MQEKIAKYKIDDFSEGQSFSLVKTIVEEEIARFAAISGDISPLHMDDDFARLRGFKGRVVHGALLLSYLSKIVGVNFPGENCLLQSLSIQFLAPVYVGDSVEISAIVDQVSLSTGVIVLKAVIKNVKTHIIVGQGKLQVGFTKIKDNK